MTWEVEGIRQRGHVKNQLTQVHLDKWPLDKECVYSVRRKVKMD